MSLVSLEILTRGAFIGFFQIIYCRAVKVGEVELVSFKIPGAPYNS